MKRCISLCLAVFILLTCIANISVFAQSENLLSAELLADTQVITRLNGMEGYNYGSKTSASISRKDNGGYAFLKFSLPQIPEDKQIESAKLILTTYYPPNNNPGNDYFAARVLDDNWEEGNESGAVPSDNGIVGTDVLSLRTDALGTKGSIAISDAPRPTAYIESDVVRNDVVSIDVTEIIQQDYMDGNIITSLAIATMSNTNNGAGNLGDWSIYTKEGDKAKAAKLELTTCEKELVPKELSAELEADVRISTNSSEANFNYGAMALAQVYGAQRSVYFRFSLPQVPKTHEVLSAKLRIYTVSDVSDYPLSIARVSSDTWTEGNLTGSRPEAGSDFIIGSKRDDKNGGYLGGEVAPGLLQENPSPINYVISAARNSWIELDVTDIILNDYYVKESDKTSISLYSTVNGGPNIVTKENATLGENKAQLILETQKISQPDITNLRARSLPEDSTKTELTWTDPQNERFLCVDIYKDNVLFKTIPKGEEYFILEDQIGNLSNYKFFARDSFGNLSEGIVYENLPLAPVEGFCGVKTESHVLLAWNEIDDFRVTKILIYNEDLETPIVELNPDKVSYEIENTFSSDTYYIRVTDGENFSEIAQTTLIDYNTPPVIADLKSEGGDGFVKLSWEAVNRPDIERIEVNYLIDGSPVQVSLPRTATSAVINGLVNGTRYKFTVILYTSKNSSEPASVIENPRGDILRPLSDVENVSVITSYDQANISFTEPDCECVGYRIYDNEILMADIPKGENTAVLTNLINGKTYDFEIVTVDANGNYSDGVFVSVTPKAVGFDVIGISYTLDGIPIDYLPKNAEFEVQADIISDFDEVQTAVMIVAQYDNNDNLINCQVSSTKEFTKGNIDNICLNIIANTNATYIKTFIFENLSNISPRCNCEIFPTPGDPNAELSLNTLFTNGAVLQREKPIVVWREAAPDKTITVTLKDQTVSSKVLSTGKWYVELEPEQTDSNGTTLTVTDGETTKTVSDILIGEVWIASGQSNMTRAVSSSDGYDVDEVTSLDSSIRYFQHSVNLNDVEDSPRDNPINGTWRRYNENYRNLNSTYAIPYYFSKELFELLDRKVPVGIIESAQMGSTMQTWTNWEYLANLDTSVKGEDNRENSGRAFASNYNKYISPIVPYGARGVIWYQGEHNVADGFYELFENMVYNWRDSFSQDLSFVTVQLAGYDEKNYPERREIQFDCSEKIDNVYMVSAHDMGDQYDIHPIRKKAPGERAALSAAENVYNLEVRGTQPYYSSYEINGSEMTVYFNAAYDGLRLIDENSPLHGFQICAEDGVYYDADARITGINQVTISSDKASVPYAARYGWDNVFDNEKPTDVNVDTVNNKIILTYESISDKYNIGDMIDGFKIVQSGSATNFVNAVVISQNQIELSQDGLTLKKEDTYQYCFNNFPYQTLNLCNSEGLPVLSFRTDRSK